MRSVLLLIDLIPYSVLKSTVLILLLNQFVELDRLIQLVRSKCLRRLVESRLAHFV